MDNTHVIWRRQSSKSKVSSEVYIRLLWLCFKISQLLEYVCEIILQIFLKCCDSFTIHTKKWICLCHSHWEHGIACKNLYISKHKLLHQAEMLLPLQNPKCAQVWNCHWCSMSTRKRFVEKLCADWLFNWSGMIQSHLRFLDIKENANRCYFPMQAY